MQVELPYGRSPISIELDDESRVVDLPSIPSCSRPLFELLDEALLALTDRPARATVIVSDATRDEPRRAFVDAIRRRLRVRA